MRSQSSEKQNIHQTQTCLPPVVPCLSVCSTVWLSFSLLLAAGQTLYTNSNYSHKLTDQFVYFLFSQFSCSCMTPPFDYKRSSMALGKASPQMNPAAGNSQPSAAFTRTAGTSQSTVYDPFPRRPITNSCRGRHKREKIKALLRYQSLAELIK